jgi:C1A family cysteine protease
MNYKIVLGLAAVAALSASSFFYNRQQIQKLHLKDHLTFVQWKNTQNKAYSSPKEEQYRKLNFYRNLRDIEAVNTDASLTYKAGLNQFSDLTEEEFVIKYTGFTGVNTEDGVPHVNAGQINDDDVDWTTQGAVNPVKNQGQCGSCWAFSAVGAAESAWEISGQKLASFSEQQLVDCSSAYGNQGCNGGLMNNAFNYWIKSSKGIALESAYPYTAKDGTCKWDASMITGTIRAFSVIAQQDCDGLLHAITQQPVSVGIAANAIMSYTSGIFNNARCGTQLNHGVVAVGYGTQNGQEFWKVRNSWGASWGENGYIRFLRDDNKREPGLCGICLAASYPTV